MKIVILAASQQNEHSSIAPYEVLDQPGQDNQWAKLPLRGQRRLLSDWADTHADLSVRRAHMPFCLFCRVATFIYYCFVLFTEKGSF